MNCRLKSNPAERKTRKRWLAGENQGGEDWVLLAGRRRATPQESIKKKTAGGPLDRPLPY